MRRNRPTNEPDSTSLFNQFLVALSEAEHIDSESKLEQLTRLFNSTASIKIPILDSDGRYQNERR
jgi:hypothetical protein